MTDTVVHSTGLCRKIPSEECGAVAAEYALIAIPFFFLVLGFIELCLIFFVSSLLQESVERTARRIQTGQVQEFTENSLAQEMCQAPLDIRSCKDLLQVKIRVITDIEQTSHGANQALDDIAAGINVGNTAISIHGGDIVVVRAKYDWPLLTPILSRPLANSPDNILAINAVIAIRSEAF